MPRDLGDVLHYFLPTAGDAGPETTPVTTERPAALPIVALPIGSRDVVRAAYAWNLAVEIARLGASATLLAPADGDAGLLWPPEGRGPVGAELALVAAEGLGDLARAALDIAVSRAADASDGGLVLVRVPPAWLGDSPEGRPLMRWVLLFSTAERSELIEAYTLAKRVLASSEQARVGITIHGVRRVADARGAFEHIAGVAARHLRRPLSSYGLLVDDLDVYRAIVARRPIGLAHPQSPAARALRDVARLVVDDGRKISLA